MLRTTPYALASISLCLALAGCPKQAPETSTTSAPTRSMPAPLAEKPFTMPPVQTATLDNGVTVQLVKNDEVPLFNLRLLVGSGSWQDPAGQEGLTSATFDIMDTAAGDRDSQALSRELNRLGGSVGAGGGLASAVVSASGLTRNLDPILDVWADVLLRPSFPADEWDLERTNRVANIKRRKEDPTAIGSDVYNRLVYGDVYAGRRATEASYAAIDRDDMVALHRRAVHPANSTILVAGDVQLDTLVDLLNEKLADWSTPKDAIDARQTPPAAPTLPDEATLFFVHKAGAAQSVIRTGTLVGDRLDPDMHALMLANTAFGGAFTARVNMNLREDKGYTYGARCGTTYRHGPGVWGCSTSVSTPTTGPSLIELRKELDEVLTSRPITQDELDFFKSYRIDSYPRQFETADGLTSQWAQMWTYGLPDDWLERYVPGVRAVDLETANRVFRERIDPSKVFYLVVGDRDVIGADLEAFGLPIVALDAEGNPVEVP